MTRRLLGRAHRPSKTTALALLALLVAVAGAGAAVRPGGGGRVRACVDRGDGEMFAADGAACPGESFLVAWNAEPPTGAAGARGADGERGAPGAAGRRGPQGVPGATGATGARGETGPEGDRGKSGDAGPTGAAGTRGPRGETGASGAAGARGTRGATGPVGSLGAPGPPGAIGEPGPAGATGEPGPAGPASLRAAEVATGSINFFTSSSGNHESVTATCAPGKKVTGGGAYTDELADWLQSEGPTAEETGWNVTYVIRPGFTEAGKDVYVMAFAYCSVR